MEETARRRHWRWFFTLAVTLAGMALVIFVLPRLLGFFWPFVVGWIAALLAAPVVRLAQNRLHIRRKNRLSALLVVAVLLVLLGLIYLALDLLIGEIIAFIPDVPVYIDNIVNTLDSATDMLADTLKRVPSDWNDTVDQLLVQLRTELLDWAADLGKSFSAQLGQFAGSLPRALFNTIITVMCSYYLISQNELLTSRLTAKMPAPVIEFYANVKKSLKKALGGYFMAEFKMCWIVAFMLLIGFWIMDLNFAFFLAILVAFIDFLPVFGSGTILIPWALVQLLYKNWGMALGLALLYLLTQGFKQIVGPKIMGDTMGLNPLLTVLFLYVGFRLAGIGGMIFGIPIGMAVVEICSNGIFDPALGCLREMLHDLYYLIRRRPEQEDSNGK